MSWKILQLDDEKVLAQMYETKFKEANFEYVWIKHPPTDKNEDLINYVLKIKPDLIIMDIIMPVMDGFKATKILKKDKRTNKIPIFFLSNLLQKKDIEKGIELGAEDYFINSKFMPSEVVKKVQEYLTDPNSYKKICK